VKQEKEEKEEDWVPAVEVEAVNSVDEHREDPRGCESSTPVFTMAAAAASDQFLHNWSQ